VLLSGSAHAQVHSLMKFPDPRGEFVRQCVPRMQGRWAHPESVCGCLHDHAVASIGDSDLRQALLRGISETGVPNIESDWVPPSKRSETARLSPGLPSRRCNACSRPGLEARKHRR
jgi:hypothetical protein